MLLESNPLETWRPGELLNVRRFSDGLYRITRLGEEFDNIKQNGICLEYDRCQEFISNWYAPSNVRERENARRTPPRV